MERLEGHDGSFDGPQAVLDRIDDPHPALVNLEDLEPVGDPVPNLSWPRHDSVVPNNL